MGSEQDDQLFLRETCPCNVYPLEPHFYKPKLGYTGVYLFYLFLLQNIDCGYSLEPPRRAGGQAGRQAKQIGNIKINSKGTTIERPATILCQSFHRTRQLSNNVTFISDVKMCFLHVCLPFLVTNYMYNRHKFD